MKIRHLLEGAEPKMPGAPSGISIMTPQQFVAKAGDMPGEESEQGVAEALISPEDMQAADWLAKDSAMPMSGPEKLAALRQAEKDGRENQGYRDSVARGNTSGKISQMQRIGYITDQRLKTAVQQFQSTINSIESNRGFDTAKGGSDALVNAVAGIVKQAQAGQMTADQAIAFVNGQTQAVKANPQAAVAKATQQPTQSTQSDVTEDQGHLARIRKLSGLDEATALPAQSREFGGDEFQDYMKRIVGTPDLDKSGNVKVDKKGIEKYKSGKTKTDKYKMPYIHRSSVVEYLGPDGKTYSEDAVKATLKQRPKALLKQNEKMKHSNGELEQFFNVGFAALTGIAVDEQTDKLIIVNTCPGAGSCKVDCFAMKGGKVQFKNAWQSDGRILTYLLNDPDGFFNKLSAEISHEEKLGDKGGYEVTIRWHDAGDFFSPEYLDMALKMAQKHPGVKFYAYTKMANAALAKKPANFIINWSEGAHTSQEKQVKASDPTLEKTKNSRIVPDELFQDLLIKDQKGNLVKGSGGQWQVQPDKLPELKQRLAKQYGLTPNSILSYDEYTRKPKVGGMKYNVIVAPGEGDISANDQNVLSTLLLRH